MATGPYSWKRYTEYPYSWVKRVSKYERLDMQELVAGMNELAHEDWQTHGYILEHRLERCGDAWGVVSYIVKVHEDVADQYTIGQRLYAMSLVRCNSCGAIRELDEGQIAFCLKCEADWEK